MTRIYLDGSLRIQVASPQDGREHWIRELCQLVTMRNPAWNKARQQGRSTAQIDREIQGWAWSRVWAGWELRLPRGLTDMVVRLADSIEDRTTIGQQLPPCRISCESRAYQVEAASALVHRGLGIVEAPCGAGKTTTALRAVAAAGRHTLILCHTLDLVEQWRERCASVLGLEAGQVGGGKDRIAPITVATVQTLAFQSMPDLRALVAPFGVLIVDECHMVPARTVARVVGEIPARYRWGLSATPYRDDGLGEVITWHMGPVVHRTHQEALIECGTLMAPDVQRVDTGWTPPPDLAEDTGKIAQVYTALVEDPDRNALLLDLAARELAEGRTLLILTQRKAHVDAIAEGLRARGLDAEGLTSAVSKKKRADILDRFRAGALRCVIATQLADEGLDVPILDRVILACPTRGKRRTVQRLGRLMRPAKGKDRPVLYDLVDAWGPFLSQWRARQAAYRSVLGWGGRG